MSNESEFERNARALLRERADSLDGATRSRLTMARHAALAQLRQPVRWWSPRVLVPGGAAAAVLLALILWNGSAPNLPGSSGPALDDMDLLADAEVYELSLEPDLQFVQWAAAMADDIPAGT